MKKIIIPVVFASSLLFLDSCDTLNEVAETLINSTSSSSSSTPLTNADVISGLKEALTVGIKNSVNLTSVTDGFLKNDSIKIPFPADAIKVRNAAIKWGLTSEVEQFETTLNRAAEQATKTAVPIFVSAITNMSISDGFSILNGGNGAATKYLKEQTTSQLTTAFKPTVDSAIATVKLTEYWEPIISRYNKTMKLTGGTQINSDLSSYVTEKAINGLFYMVEQEEDKIRQDPTARVTEILQKVFGSLGN